MKSALIVGASRGLGTSLATALVERKISVLALCREDSPRLIHARQAAPEWLEIERVDVRQEQDFERASRRIDEKRRFDLLVYNAAVHLERDRLDIEAANIDHALETLDVNAVGALRALKHLGRFVAPGGLVTFISSEAGSLTNNSRASEYGYCMSKAALNMFTSLMGVREAKRGSGIRVLAMHPGWLRTDMGGPNADVDPDQAATDIVNTLLSREGSEGPPFVDRFGEAMAW